MASWCGMSVFQSERVRCWDSPDWPVPGARRRCVSFSALIEPDAGKIFVDGVSAVIRSPRDAIRHRICLLTEDRKAQGVILKHSVRENFGLPNLDRYVRGPFLDQRQERMEAAATWMTSESGSPVRSRWWPICRVAISRRWCSPNGWLEMPISLFLTNRRVVLMWGRNTRSTTDQPAGGSRQSGHHDQQRVTRDVGDERSHHRDARGTGQGRDHRRGACHSGRYPVAGDCLKTPLLVTTDVANENEKCLDELARSRLWCEDCSTIME